VTDPTLRNTRPAADQPVMGDHPDLETEDLPQAESIDNGEGRSRLVMLGIAVLVLVAIVIVLTFI
jgi:hypothetical protein